MYNITDRQVHYRRSNDDPAKLEPYIEVFYPESYERETERAIVKANGAVVLDSVFVYTESLAKGTELIFDEDDRLLFGRELFTITHAASNEAETAKQRNDFRRDIEHYEHEQFTKALNIVQMLKAASDHGLDVEIPFYHDGEPLPNDSGDRDHSVSCIFAHDWGYGVYGDFLHYYGADKGLQDSRHDSDKRIARSICDQILLGNKPVIGG